MQYTRIALVGGSGFVGRHLTYQLNKHGYQCCVITRHAHRYRALRVSAEVREANPFSSDELSQAFAGYDAVVNLVGILNKSKNQGFRKVHIDLTETVVEACHRVGIKRLLHMSALQADQATGSSQYLRTKGEAENRAHTLGQPDIAVTSFRPSVIFGPDDSFLNRFAQLLKLPGPMPLACAGARFAPVYVEDVTAAFIRALEDKSTRGKRYDLCGPDIFTLEEIVRFVAQLTHTRKSIIPLPDWASRIQAGLLQFAPGKPFTPDNYSSLKSASVCSSNGLVELSIEPTSMQAVATRFFSKSNKTDIFNVRRQHSRR